MINSNFVKEFGLNKENNILAKVPDSLDKIWKKHELQGLADYLLFLATQKFGEKISCTVIVANKNKSFNIYTIADGEYRKGPLGMKDMKKLVSICNKDGIPCFLIEEATVGGYRIIPA